MVMAVGIQKPVSSPEGSNESDQTQAESSVGTLPPSFNSGNYQRFIKRCYCKCWKF